MRLVARFRAENWGKLIIAIESIIIVDIIINYDNVIIVKNLPSYMNHPVLICNTSNNKSSHIVVLPLQLLKLFKDGHECSSGTLPNCLGS